MWRKLCFEHWSSIIGLQRQQKAEDLLYMSSTYKELSYRQLHGREALILGQGLQTKPMAKIIQAQPSSSVEGSFRQQNSINVRISLSKNKNIKGQLSQAVDKSQIRIVKVEFDGSSLRQILCHPRQVNLVKGLLKMGRHGKQTIR